MASSQPVDVTMAAISGVEKACIMFSARASGRRSGQSTGLQAWGIAIGSRSNCRAR